MTNREQHAHTEQEHPSVTVVVVTYNRKNLLEACLKSIKLQSRPPDKVLIVDNASTDGTREWLQTWLPSHIPCAKILYMESNTGGAGGFNAGMKVAYEEGADWIWLMDDDCEPSKSALEQLLNAKIALHHNGINDIGFLSSRIEWSDGSPCRMNLPVVHNEFMETHSYAPNLVRICAGSFVSLLVSRKAIRTCGLPIKEFFIWFDDSEYSHRISEKYRAYMVSTSLVVHNTMSNDIPMDFSKMEISNAWKYYYGLRNESSWHWGNGLASGLLYNLKIIYRSLNHKLSAKCRLIILKALLNGTYFRYRRFVEHV